MFTFGAGFLVATPNLDINGVAVANPSPVQFGTLQEVSVDESFEMKPLYGALKFPVAVGQGKGKVSIKVKEANINAELWNSLFYGTALLANYKEAYNDLAGTSVPTSPGNITPTIHGTAIKDLGVTDVNGVPLVRVATAPTSGQYTFDSNTGVYGFDPVHDFNKQYFINYAYAGTASAAKKELVIPNQAMGTQPVISLVLQEKYQGKMMYVEYPNVISTNMSRTFKNDDWTIYDFTLEAFADTSNNISYVYLYE
jgi:hypothetical protein